MIARLPDMLHRLPDADSSCGFAFTERRRRYRCDVDIFSVRARLQPARERFEVYFCDMYLP